MEPETPAAGPGRAPEPAGRSDTVCSCGGPAPVGGVAGTGPASATGTAADGERRAATIAAPSPTEYLGCASTTTGRPTSSAIMRLTSGIRDDPPTSSTADSS